MQVKLKWVTLCAYYQKQLPDLVIEMYCQDVSDLDSKDVCSALDLWRRNPKNRTVPLPAQIREMIRPEFVDEDSESREICSRIIESITKFGYPNGSDARNFIGEAGWTVVTSYGGWSHLCQNLGTKISVDSFNAQARELLKSRIKSSPQQFIEVGYFEKMKELPEVKKV